MKQLILMASLCLLMTACGEAGYKKAEDAQEAAREFIRASLDGNYDKALFYLYKDSLGVNEMLLSKWRNDYDKWKEDEKIGHKKSNILVLNTEKVNDSTLNYIYSNSFKNDTTTIKIVRRNNEWLVDLQDIH